MIAVTPFLSAYDPSDLPGASIDPLGFERGYLHLAEKFLPGLTNVASRPRYFGVLCAGILLADTSTSDSPRAQFQKRSETVLRLERFWGLANVLASRSESGSELPLHGIRGLRYVERKAGAIEQKGEDETTGNFQVLSRQAPYGLLGIYGSVAERLRFLLDRRMLTLTPDLGDRLGEAFLRETKMPKEIQDAVRSDRPVSVQRLREWGIRAHVAGGTGEDEAACIENALNLNETRRRVGELLAECPLEEGEEELARLARVLANVRGKSGDLHIAETLDAIINYERAYRLVQLALERVLWLCSAKAAVPPNELYQDQVIEAVMRQLSSAVSKFNESLNEATTEHFLRDNHQRLHDVKVFLTEIASASKEPDVFIEILLRRHREVQHGKFDRGRRKAPWVEMNAKTVTLTMTRVGGAGTELTGPDEVVPHFYRTDAVDALREAAHA